MSAINLLLNSPAQTARLTRLGALVKLAALSAILCTAGGCASGVGDRSPVQFDLRGPVSPAASVFAPAEAPRVFAAASPQSWIAGVSPDPNLLLASNQASAAAADPSLQAGGF